MLPCLFVFFSLCYISALSFLVCSITNVFSKLDATNHSSLIFCVASLLCTTRFSTCILFKHVVKLAMDLAVFHIVVLIIALMK